MELKIVRALWLEMLRRSNNPRASAATISLAGRPSSIGIRMAARRKAPSRASVHWSGFATIREPEWLPQPCSWVASLDRFRQQAPASIAIFSRVCVEIRGCKTMRARLVLFRTGSNEQVRGHVRCRVCNNIRSAARVWLSTFNCVDFCVHAAAGMVVANSWSRAVIATGNLLKDISMSSRYDPEHRGNQSPQQRAD